MNVALLQHTNFVTNANLEMGCKILHPAMGQGCDTESDEFNPSIKEGAKKMPYLIPAYFSETTSSTPPFLSMCAKNFFFFRVPLIDLIMPNS